MSVVKNNTQRLINVKAMAQGKRVVVRLVPGLNSVTDAHWKVCMATGYVKELIKDGKLAHGKELDEMELDTEMPKADSKAEASPVKDKK